jgi:Tol biopolymer transport system component
VKISLTSSANPSQVGQSVTFTANAASVQGVPPDGELIVFKVSNKVLAKVPLVAGSASVTTSTLKTGTHQVTAQYVGDVHYFASKSPALNQIVNP